MPVNLQINKEKIKRNISELKKSIKVEQDVMESVVKNTEYYISLSKNTLGRIFALVTAVNKFLGLFGSSINVEGIEISTIEEVFDSINIELQRSKENIEEELNIMEGLYVSVSDSINDVVIDFLKNTEANADGTITWPDFNETKNELIQSFVDTRETARQTDLIVERIGLFFNLADKIGGDLAVIVNNIKDLIETVVNKIFQILDAANDVALFLRGAAIVADKAPFNLFPGSLAVAMGLLAELSSTLKSLSDQLLGISSATNGVSDAAKRLAILAKNWKDIGITASQATGYVAPPKVE